MGKPRFVAGMDVGSTKTCALVGEVMPNGELRVLGASTVPARGIQRGAVVDLEAAAATVGGALSQVTMATGQRIDSVLLGTSVAVASLNSRGTATARQPDRPITLDDARRAVVAAADSGMPGSRQVLHAVPRRFLVDGQAGVSNPVGLFGRRIDADAHIVTAAGPTVRALIACVERWGAEVEEVVAQPLAAAQAVLRAEEREQGVVVADVGAGSCGVSVFVDGSPWHTATVPVGGRHLTQDVATVLGISYEVAEELKLTAGHAIPTAVDPSEGIDAPQVEGEGEARISRRELCEIIEARVLELIGLIGEEIRRSGYAGLLPAGLVLTGGTAQLPGIARLASETLQLRVRIGQPAAVGEGGVSGPAYASAVGLLRWGLRAPSNRWWTYPGHGEPRAEGAHSPFAIARWWRALLPPALGGERSEQRWL